MGDSEAKHGFSLITEHDTYLFKEGNHFRLYEKMGSHIGNVAGEQGTFFAVWAPNAKEVSVIGDFNFWDKETHPLAVGGTARVFGRDLFQGSGMGRYTNTT